jgi:hypothetical protein
LFLATDYNLRKNNNLQTSKEQRAKSKEQRQKTINNLQFKDLRFTEKQQFSNFQTIEQRFTI